MKCGCGKAEGNHSLNLTITIAETGAVNEHKVDNICSDCGYKMTNLLRTALEMKKAGLNKGEIVKMLFNMTEEEFDKKLEGGK